MNKYMLVINLMIIMVCSSVMAMNWESLPFLYGQDVYKYTKKEIIENQKHAGTVYREIVNDVILTQLIVSQYDNKGTLLVGSKILHKCEEYNGRIYWSERIFISGNALEQTIKKFEDKRNGRI